jgi:hypothetical protein
MGGVKASLFGYFVAGSLFATLVETNVSANTVTIDFSGIPDYTPLSADHSFGGIVDFQAQAGYSYTGPGNVFGQTLIDAGVFYQGSIYVGAGGSDIIPAGTVPDKSWTYLTLNFLTPVTQVSFATLTEPWSIPYVYTGVDAQGNPISGNGGTPLPDAAHPTSYTTVLTAPPGGSLTQVVLRNWDYYAVVGTHFTYEPVPQSGSPFSFTDLTVTLGSVPEPSALSDKAFLMLLLAAAPFVARKTLRRAV